MFPKLLLLFAFLLLWSSQPLWADFGDAKESCRAGLQLEREGDDDGALRQYQVATEQDPQCAEAWRLIAYCQGRRKQYRDAFSALDHYFALNATDLTVQQYSNRLHLEAMQAQQQPASQAPVQPQPQAQATPQADAAAVHWANAESFLRLGMKQERAGDLRGAFQSYRNALRWDRRCVDAWVGLGDCYAALGRAPEALRAYDHYLQVRPDNPSIRVKAETLRMQFSLVDSGPGARFDWE